MKQHYEIRFSGTGGQGMMLMGDIFAAAAGYYDNQEIVLTKSYGPESRGGACRSELIIDSNRIDYPVLTKPDFILAMSQKACDTYAKDLVEQGVLLVDSGFVSCVPSGNFQAYALPITDIAMRETGKGINANIVAIGAITALGDCASSEAVRSAICERFPEKLHHSVLAAFEAGMREAETLLME